MIDLASIRNASFTLTPTGYNPEEVDRFLADLADQLEAQPISIEAAPAAATPAAPPAPAPAPRPEADLDGLTGAIDRTIGALDAFVQNELAAVRAASDLEVEEIHRERERLLEEAADAARAHLEEAKARAEDVATQVRAERRGGGRAASSQPPRRRRARRTKWWPRPHASRPRCSGRSSPPARRSASRPTSPQTPTCIAIESNAAAQPERTAEPEADDVRDATDAAA